MKNLLFIFLSLAYLISILPTIAINRDTHVLPIIGSTTEKIEKSLSEKIDLAPIKLPQEIHHFNLLEAERALLPNLLKDQISAWTSPLRMRVKDLKWFIPACGILTTLLIVDEPLSRILTDNHEFGKTRHDISDAFGQISGVAPVLGLPGSLILTGIVTKNDRLRETGILQYEGIVTSGVLYEAFKPMFGRNKPNKIEGKGEFFKGSTSFPSGHTVFAWTLATIAANQYSEKKWVPIVGYSIASVVSASRVTQDLHFVSDVVVSALIGYLVGKSIVKYNSKFSPKSKEKS